MMLTRGQRVLIGLLVAQLVVLVLVRHPFGAAPGAKDHPLLPKLASITPSKLEVTDDQGATVTLDHSNGAWVLTQPQGYPVAAGKAEKLIQSLEHLNVGRPLVTSPVHHATLRVAEDAFERRVKVWPDNGKDSALVVYLGKSPSTGTTAVRAGGRNEVYEVSDVSTSDAPSKSGDWIDHNLIPIQADQVTRLDLRNPKGSFSVEKRDGRWKIVTPASRAAAALDSTKVLGLLRSLCEVSVDEPMGAPAGRAPGLSRPDATIALTGSGDASSPAAVTARIGAEAPDHSGDRYAARTGLDFAVLVKSWSADRALNATLGDLLAK